MNALKQIEADIAFLTTLLGPHEYQRHDEDRGEWLPASRQEVALDLRVNFPCTAEALEALLAGQTVVYGPLWLRRKP